MIFQSFKLIWRRKGANALLILEIAISFLVLFAVCLGALAAWTNARHPLGFDRENVWALAITEGGQGPARASETSTSSEAPEKAQDVSRRLLREVQQLPEVAAAALVDNAPYEMSESNSTYVIDGVRYWMETNIASDEFAETLGLNVIAGRWFDESDQGANYVPVVLNRSLAEEMFGNEDPVGRSLDDERFETERRVVGVIDDYRRQGELARLGNFLFHRQPSDPTATYALRNLLVRVQPGVPRSWERTLVSRLEALAPGVSVRVRTVDELRSLSRQFTLIPLAVGVVLAAFLMIMVLLGLLGVLWQDVTRRRKEIGLRRALGAHAGAVQAQIMGELFVLVCFGLLAGTIVIVQFPLFGVRDLVGPSIFVGSLVLAAALTLLLAGLAGLQPSRLATRIQPAEALHHD